MRWVLSPLFQVVFRAGGWVGPEGAVIPSGGDRGLGSLGGLGPWSKGVGKGTVR